MRPNKMHRKDFFCPQKVNCIIKVTKWQNSYVVQKVYEGTKIMNLNKSRILYRHFFTIL